jgi:hypothetical protein
MSMLIRSRRSARALAALAVLVGVLVPAIPASAAAPSDPDPEDLGQAVGETSLAEGGITNATVVTFSVAAVSDPDNSPEPTQQLSIEVEVKPTDDPLDGSDVVVSNLVDEGETASVDSGPLGPGTYHWQVRVVDGADEASGFVEFGVGEGFDFRVNAAPDDPVDLAQADDEGSVAEGGVTNDTTPTFSASVSDDDNDPDPTDALRLEIEVESSDTTFDGDGTQLSGPSVGDGSASVTSSALTPDTYHWRARTVDEHGASSGWVVFGSLEVEEEIRVNAAPNDPTDLTQADGGPIPSPNGVTNETTVTLGGNVTDPDGGDQVALEVEVVASGGTFADTPTEGADLGAQGTQSVDVSPGYGTWDWQARTVDEHDAVSAWVPGGTFRINEPPIEPTDLAQSDSEGPLAAGDLTNDTTIDFDGTLSDPDGVDQLRLEVELQPLGTGFGNEGSTSDPVAEGGTATATLTDIAVDTSYHWQARTVDEHGATSDWLSFGDNVETDADFRIPSADVSVDQTLPAEVFASSGATTRTLEYSFTISNADDIDAATPVIATIDFDDDRIVALSALYGIEDEGGCDPDTALGAGNTVTLTSLAAGEDVTVCIAVDVESSPSPLIDGALASSQTVSVASPVHDPDTDNNADTDSVDIVTTPGAPRAVTAFAGNESAVVSWKQPSLDTDGFPVNDGGDGINHYVVTVEKVAPNVVDSLLPGPFTVTAPSPSPSDKAIRLAIGTDIAESLTNGQGYRFVVTAVNDVGTGPGTTSNSIVPSLDASAEIIDVGAGNSIQSTGNPTQPNTCALPVASDSITGCQEFKGNTNGIGNILEKAQPTSNFCGTAPCLGSQVIQYEITDLPDGRVLLSATYSKQLAGSTGTNFKVYYDRDGPKTDFGPGLLAACPKKGPATNAPACVFKITRLGPSNVGANPNLRVTISAPAGDAIDPAAGTRR